MDHRTPSALDLLQIPYLHNYWKRHTAPSTEPRDEQGEWDLENTLLSGLNLNLLETSRFLQGPPPPTLEAFADWIVATNGGSIDPTRLTRLRDALAGLPVCSAAGSLEDVQGLTDEELANWDEHGYVVLHNAVAPADRDAAAAAIYAYLDANPNDPVSWYGKKFGQSIWVPLLRHPAFLANRQAPRLVKAFAQLWGREDLWPTIDQGGLNPPERADWHFQGPYLHWDMTLAQPHVFSVQGILYLTDTPANQGAFCCIPGFHRVLESWLASLPEGEDPRKAIMRHPGLKPIAGRAGDLVLWHHALPHSSSPNHGQKPRVVQYIILRPTRWPYTAEWR